MMAAASLMIETFQCFKEGKKGVARERLRL